MSIVETFVSPVVAHAKLLPPRLRSETVYRRELVDRVRSSPATLTVITGPAGSGKSTLMAQIHAEESPSAWVSLDRGDNDPVVLWWAVIESLRQLVPDLGDDYRHRLMAVGPAVIEEVVVSIANELDAVKGRMRLFLDDIHHVEEALCQRSLHSLLRHLPPTVGVVVGARGAPPLPLARFRVEGNLLEIGAPELAMSTDDAVSLFEGLGLAVDRSSVEILVDRTEGWPAGLQLAQLAMTRSDDVEAFIRTFEGSDRFVAEYLITEVLELMSDDDRRFLSDTALLDRLSGDLCNAVTGRDDSAGRLVALERMSAFVISLDEAGVWYRYHHLFAELLRSRLASLPVDVRELHERASAWFRDNGFVDEAVGHALEAGLRRDAADILCASWWGLLGTGRVETARALLESFEQREVVSYQPLAIAAAFIYAVVGDAKRARMYLGYAEKGTYSGPPPDGSATIESSLALVRGGLAIGGVEESLIDGLVAHELEPIDSPWRPLAAMIIGLALIMKDDLEEAAPYLEEVSRAPDDALKAYGLAELSHLQLARGDAEGAAAIAEEAAQLVEQSGLGELIPAASIYAAMARSALALGNPEKARAALDGAAGPMEYIGQGLPLDVLRIRVLLADVALQLGDHETALRYTNSATRVASALGDTGVLGDELAKLRARWKASAPPEAEGAEDTSPFTEREIEVLALLPLGLTTREIGEELFLSKNTVKTYLRRLYRKLDVSTRGQAIEQASEMGLLPD